MKRDHVTLGRSAESRPKGLVEVPNQLTWPGLAQTIETKSRRHLPPTPLALVRRPIASPLKHMPLKALARGSGMPVPARASEAICVSPTSISIAATATKRPPSLVRFQANRTLSRHRRMTECDPNVWSGRAVQENSSSWRMCGLASMYPAFDWSVLCSGPSWISARLRYCTAGAERAVECEKK
jgi:hypothetical protein